MAEDNILEQPVREHEEWNGRAMKAVLGLICFILAVGLLWLDFDTQNDLEEKYMFGAVLFAGILAYFGWRLLFVGNIRTTAPESVEAEAFVPDETHVQCPYCGAVLELSAEEAEAREYLCPECSSRVRMETHEMQ